MGTVAVEEVSVVGSEVGVMEGGVPVSTTTIGVDNVSVAMVYVPVGTLVKLRGTEKSIRQAKSSVTGDDTTETGAPPPSGVKVMLIVTVNDTTSQAGASPVKTTVEPMLTGCGVLRPDDVVPPPEQLSMAANAASEATSSP
jgi:hypothetical protein